MLETSIKTEFLKNKKLAIFNNYLIIKTFEN